MAHLEQQAKDIKDREDLVPFTGEKRGMVIHCTVVKAGRVGSLQWTHSRATPSSCRCYSASHRCCLCSILAP